MTQTEYSNGHSLILFSQYACLLRETHISNATTCTRRRKKNDMSYIDEISLRSTSSNTSDMTYKKKTSGNKKQRSFITTCRIY